MIEFMMSDLDIYGTYIFPLKKICKLCWIITLMNWFFLVNQKYTVQCDYSKV